MGRCELELNPLNPKLLTENACDPGLLGKFRTFF